MKARILFYFAAEVALVLILASVPSHATERRDPLIIQDTSQTQTAKSSSPAHATASAKRPMQSSPRKPKTANTAGEKSSHQGVNPLFEAKDKSVAKKNSPGPSKSTSSTENGTGTSKVAE